MIKRSIQKIGTLTGLALALMASAAMAKPAAEAPTPNPAMKEHIHMNEDKTGYAYSVIPDFDNFDPAPFAKQIKMAEEYLSKFRTMETRFSQTTHGMAQMAYGKFYISRPGRMRLEYMEPEKLTLIANDRHLFYYNAELDQVSYGEVPDSPLEILLYQKVNFDGTSKVVDVLENDATLSITLKPTSDDKMLRKSFTSLTLVFNKNPMELKRIMRTDEYNHATTIYLMDPVFDRPLDEGLFSTKNPSPIRKKN